MAILNFIKPDKVIMLDSSANKGVFEFRPLEPGYGITIGNAIRRVLLGSLEGYAICSVKISGIDHEFATIPGVIPTLSSTSSRYASSAKRVSRRRARPLSSTCVR